MPTVTPLSPTTAADQSAPATRTTSVARNALADNLDTFLSLLTTQLQNQDPLEPLETNQFVDQLTQFSELEQGVETNETLSSIASTLGADDRQADLNLLGTVVEAESEIFTLPDGENASFALEITSPSERAEVRIFDAGDNLLATFEVDGSVGRVDAGWDGSIEGGGRAGPGLYRAQVVAIGEDGTERLAGRTLTSGFVNEVRFENGETQLILHDGLTITSDEIRRVGLPSSS